MISWKLAALVCFPLLAGCGKRTVCTSEVTAGSGTFTAVAEGRRPRAELERDALHFACQKLCGAGKSTTTDEACVSRCAVDALAGKIGARTTCSEGTR